MVTNTESGRPPFSVTTCRFVTKYPDDVITKPDPSKTPSAKNAVTRPTALWFAWAMLARSAPRTARS